MCFLRDCKILTEKTGAANGDRKEGNGTSMKNCLEFIGIEVSYPPPEVCCYPEYKGKPYFAIKYKEDGQYIVGFGTYNPEVLSRYIKEYFINPTERSET